MPEPMDDYTLKAIIDAKLLNALGWIAGRLSKERIRAFSYYEGDFFGNEVDGRSKVISRDVAEAIDSVMPGIIKVFASSEQVVQFNARRPEDQAAAAQATDFVNWVWQTQPDAFDILQTWIKDGLLSKLGVVKSWWDEQVDQVEESYDGLTPFQYLVLHNFPDVEIIEATTRPAPPPLIDPNAPPTPGAPAPAGSGTPSLPQAPANLPGGQAPPPNPAAMDMTAPIVLDVRVRRTNRTGRIRIEAIPPEEFLTDRRAISLSEATFCAHRSIRRVSDLIEMGYPPEVVTRLPGGTELDFNFEVLTRFQKEDEMPQRDETDNLDPAMRRVWVSECYLKVDYNGDGIAEWRKVVVAGGGAFEILENEEVDGHPFSAWTPNKMPHKLYGESLADKTADIQLIKSTLWRELMDAIYQIGTPRLICDPDQTNLEDATNTRSGGIIRAKSGAVTPVIQPDNTAGILAAINYVDSVREARTGVRRFTSATDADALNPYNNTATGARMVDDSSQDRIMLMARNFAEQGMLALFRRLFELTVKHQQQALQLRLRGKWITVDPTTWHTQFDMSVSVGLGTGNRDAQLVHINGLLGMAQQIVQAQGGLGGPLVRAQNIYSMLETAQEAAGFRGKEFFTDPSTVPPQPSQPPPGMMIEQAKLQGQMALQQHRVQADAWLSQQKAANDAQIKQVSAASDEQVAMHKAQLDDARERDRIAIELQLKREEIAARERMHAATLQNQHYAELLKLSTTHGLAQ